MTSKSTICLNMIVKNESKVILRCLESVVKHIDYWVISDTGSTDDTKEIITDYFKKHDIPGLLTEDPWEDFSHNRNISLNNAKNKADYIFMMDADDYLVASDKFSFGTLTADSYLLAIQRDNISYYFHKLIRADLDWRWEGVLHEYLALDGNYRIDKITGDAVVMSTSDGDRGQSPDKFKNDIAVLTKGLVKEPDNERYRFYLAQSYRDDGNDEQAQKHYEIRASLGGWEEEVYISMLEAGQCQIRLKADESSIIEALLKAHYFRPSRLEALYALVNYCNQNKRYQLGYTLGKLGLYTPISEDVLFVNTSIYEWMLADEMAVCASWVGHKQEAKNLLNTLLMRQDLNTLTRKRMETNLTFC
ncbi:MAG: glycosyltransferase [Thiotrichaceae bacterium]|nr:glycosyltransferase [Thiotrichaceae bacterium]